MLVCVAYTSMEGYRRWAERISASRSGTCGWTVAGRLFEGDPTVRESFEGFNEDVVRFCEGVSTEKCVWANIILLARVSPSGRP